MAPKPDRLFKLAALGKSGELSAVIKKKDDQRDTFINFTNKQGRKLMHVAALNGKANSVYELAKLGADVNAKCFEFGNTPLHYACTKASITCILTLLHLGANLHTANKRGQTPLDVIPEEKQILYGGLLRNAEKQRLNITKDHLEAEKFYNEFPIASDNCEFAIDSVYPVPFITDNFSKDESQELASGKYKIYCKGTFYTQNAMVRYSPDDVYLDHKSSLLYEALVLSEIRHPNILLLLGITSPPQDKYQLVFEGAQIFLHKLIFENKTKIRSEGLLSLSRDISAALTYLHQQGFLHCSLGCSSVTVTSENENFDSISAKICNFENAQNSADAKPISHLAKAYSYMAPEQANGFKADALNDVHALGVIIFESATNQCMHEVRPLLKNFTLKESTRFLVRMVPTSLEHSIPTLISSCLDKAKRRCSALHVFRWTDALLFGGLAEQSPLNQEDIEHITLEELHL